MKDFDKIIESLEDETKDDNLTSDDLQELKKWLFEEHTRLTQLKAEQKQVYEKFIKERSAFMEDMKSLNAKVLQERKRLKDESLFFDKKMQILQNGFMQLDLDRKKFEREKREFEATRVKYNDSSDRNYGSYSFDANDISLFFSGVNNPLALRKRYKDLLKIFHPDNLCGDERIVKAINEEYERLKKQEIS